MAVVADGTYTIINAATVSSGTPLCINSAGATDGNRANVWLYHLDQTDAQYVRIFTRSDGTRQLEFPATGKCIETFGYTVAQGANISQYSDNDSRAQRWKIIDTNSTASYGGATYKRFKIYLDSTYDASKSNNWLAEYEGTGKPVDGGNLCLAADEVTSDDQFWIFVPANPVPTGTYMIRSAIAPNCVCDVSGISMANGANVFLCAENGGNNQIWYLAEYTESGQCRLYATHSMQLMETFGASSDVHNGSNVDQGTYNGESDQLWVCTPYGVSTYNGSSVPTYLVRNVAAQGTPLVLDAGHAITPSVANSSPNIMVANQNGGLNQQWIFTPAEMYATALPVPADIRASSTSGGAGATYLDANGNTTWYPSWICDGTVYRARYRYRLRSVGKSIGDWSEWRSLADGQCGNAGWGDVASPNCITGNTWRKYAPNAITTPSIDNNAYDYAELQIEARRHESNYNGNAGLRAHGSSASQTIRLGWKPTLTVSDLGWSPEGMTINYSCDYKRGGNTLRVDSIVCGGKTLCSGYQFSGQPYAGSVTVPASALAFVPSDGASCTVAATIRTDVSSASDTYAETVKYADGHGLSVTPTYALTDDYALTITVPKHSYNACYISVGGAFEACEIASSTSTEIVYKAYPPFGVAYQTAVVCKDDSAWAFDTVSHDSVSANLFVWNFDGGCCTIGVGKDDPPEMSDSISPDSDTEVTTGREYPVYRFGNSTERDLSVTGVVADWAGAYSTRAAVDALASAHHAIFRNPIGERYHVAITGASKPIKQAGITEVTITQKAETV